MVVWASAKLTYPVWPPTVKSCGKDESAAKVARIFRLERGDPKGIATETKSSAVPACELLGVVVFSLMSERYATLSGISLKYRTGSVG